MTKTGYLIIIVIMIDLHTHTLASDGTHSPRDLALLASSLNVCTLAITDHDTTQGLSRDWPGFPPDVQILAGIELEIAYRKGQKKGAHFHLLGLDLQDWDKPELQAALAGLQEQRQGRNREIWERMQAKGFHFSWDELLEESGDGSLGRPHFARLMVKKGWARNIQKAFDHYLVPGREFYAPKPGLPLEQALSWIKRAGGLSFVAHPQSLKVNKRQARELLYHWKEMGLDGVEALHSGLSLPESQYWMALAQELGLALSGGSDFHGSGRPDRHLGRGPGGQFLSGDFLQTWPRQPRIFGQD